MFLTMDDVEHDSDDPLAFTARLATEDGAKVGAGSAGDAPRYRVYEGFFDEHVERDPDRLDRDWSSPSSGSSPGPTRFVCSFHALTCILGKSARALDAQAEQGAVADESQGRADEGRREGDGPRVLGDVPDGESVSLSDASKSVSLKVAEVGIWWMSDN